MVSLVWVCLDERSGFYIDRRSVLIGWPGLVLYRLGLVRGLWRGVVFWVWSGGLLGL